MSTKRWNFFPLLCMIAFWGCASQLAPKDAGFSDVQRVVSQRTGNEIAWDQRAKDDGAVASGTRSLLANGLTADEAAQIALLNNRRLQAIYESLGVARGELIQAGLLKNPELKGALRIRGSEDVLELAVVQDFMSIFTIPLRRARAKAEFERAKFQVTGEAMELAGRTRIAFYRLLGEQQVIAMRRSFLDAAEASYDAARRLRAAGNITALALANEQALYEQAKLMVAQAELAVLETREKLNILMGLFGEDTGWRAPDRLPPLPEKEEPLVELEAKAVRASLDLAAARFRIESTGQQLEIAKVHSLLPELGVGVEGERETDGKWFVGPRLQVAIPIFDWGQGSRNQAFAELQRARQDFTALAIEIRAAVRATYQRMEMTRRQALHYQKVIMPLGERITRETQLQYNAMQLGIFSLLAAKQHEILVTKQYIESLRDYWIARTQLAQVLNGRLAIGMVEQRNGGQR